MAIVFRLANFAQSVQYDFQSSALRPATMSRTPNGDGWMTTSMTLVARDSDTNIINSVNSIDELAETCDLYWDDDHRTASVWLEENATSETTKRSLVKSIELTPLQVGWFTPLLGKTGMQYQLTIIHSAAWENTTAATIQNTGINCLGGTLSLPAIDGSLPGRFSLLTIAGDSDNGGTLTTLWGGIKPSYASDTDFNPIVELERGTLVAPCALASDSDEASPKGTTDNIISYACTTGDVKIDYITMDNAFTSTNYDHWVGNYLVLLRAKLSTLETVRLHIDSGYIGGTVFIPGPYVYTSSTDYVLLEMGIVSMPPFVRNITAATLEQFEFQLYAMRLGAAVTLTADCLILIPTAHSFKIVNGAVEADDSSYIYSRIYEDGSISCINYGATGKVNIAAQFLANNWTYPIAGGTLVFAGQRAAIHDVDDVAEINTTSIERFRTHGE